MRQNFIKFSMAIVLLVFSACVHTNVEKKVSLKVPVKSLYTASVLKNTQPIKFQKKEDKKSTDEFLSVIEPENPMIFNLDDHDDNKDIDKKTPLELVTESKVKATQYPSKETLLLANTRYYFRPNAIYKVYCAPFRITTIFLCPGEEIYSVDAGDTARWEFATSVTGFGDTKQKIITIKPSFSGLRNNVVISTNYRTYLLDLQSFKSSYQSSVSWVYPKNLKKLIEQSSKIKDQQKNRVLISNPTGLNFSYEIIPQQEDITWKPVRVFDDGKKTFIQFPPKMKVTDAPVLFVYNNQEEKFEIVNYRVSGEYYVIDRLFNDAQLVCGEKEPYVVEIKAIVKG